MWLSKTCWRDAQLPIHSTRDNTNVLASGLIQKPRIVQKNPESSRDLEPFTHSLFFSVKH